MNQSKYINQNLTIQSKFIKDYLLSVFSHLATVFITTPLQRYQMLHIQQRRTFYSQTSKSLIQICHESTDRLYELWRVHPDDLRYTLSTGFLFALNDMFKSQISALFQDKKHSIIGFIAGGTAGFTHLFINYPVILTRLKLKENSCKQIQLQENNFILQFYKVLKQEGIIKLYSGCSLSLLSATVYRSIYFGGYNHFLKYLEVIPFLNNIITKIAISYIITTVAEIVSYPLEKMTKKRNANLTYYQDMTEVIGKYRSLRACLVIVIYGEFFKLYDKVMAPFVLDRNDLINQ